MEDEVVAVYVDESPFVARPAIAGRSVPYKDLKGHTEKEIREMAEQAAPKGFRLRNIEGLDNLLKQNQEDG